MDYIAERREEEKERRRDDILDAALLVFAAQGFDHATMDQVARQARVSRALVYVYFQDKLALQFGICLRALRLLRQKFEEARAAHRKGVNQVEAIGWAYVQFAVEHPQYFKAMSHFESHAPVDGELSELEREVLQAGQQVHAVTVQALQQGMKDGSIRKDIPDLLLTSLTMWAFTHGAIQLAQTKGMVIAQLGYQEKQFLNGAMELAIRALKP